MWLTDGFLVTFFGRWWGAVRIHVSHVQLPYTVHHTRCTIHGELTCGGGGNIRIHVYLQLPYMVNSRVVVGQYMHTCVPQLPYMVHCTRCTVHGVLTCGGVGNIHIHVYLQLLHMVYCVRCTVHGVLTCGGGGNIRIHVYLQLPYTVHRTR